MKLSCRLSVFGLDGFARGGRVQRVFRPIVFGVSAAHVLADELVAFAPKTSQVLRDLDGTVRRGKERHDDSDFAVGDFRSVHHAEAFLKTDFDGGFVAANEGYYSIFSTARVSPDYPPETRGAGGKSCCPEAPRHPLDGFLHIDRMPPITLARLSAFDIRFSFFRGIIRETRGLAMNLAIYRGGKPCSEDLRHVCACGSIPLVESTLAKLAI